MFFCILHFSFFTLCFFPFLIFILSSIFWNFCLLNNLLHLLRQSWRINSVSIFDISPSVFVPSSSSLKISHTFLCIWGLNSYFLCLTVLFVTVFHSQKLSSSSFSHSESFFSKKSSSFVSSVSTMSNPFPISKFSSKVTAFGSRYGSHSGSFTLNADLFCFNIVTQS